MIEIALPAYMTCEETDCKAKQPVSLFLCMAGGFAFKPPESGWRISASADGGPFVTRCPLHKQEKPLIQTASAIPGLQREH